MKLLESDFPRAELRAARYESLVVGQKSWNGVAVLARGTTPIVIRRAFPGGAKDFHARYFEAAASGIIVAGLYAPNGKPYPGPKFDYKVAWMERLVEHAKGLWEPGIPSSSLGTSTSFRPTSTCIRPRATTTMRCCRPSHGLHMYAFLGKVGPTAFASCIQRSRCTRSGTTGETAGGEMPGSELTTSRLPTF